MATRRNAILLAGSLVGLSGCSRAGDPTNEESYPPSPDYRTVEIRNEGNQSREVEIEVSTNNELLYEGTHNINPGETRLIYNTSTDGLGSTSIDVRVSTDSDNVTRTNSGVDQPPIEIEPDGNLTAFTLEA